jgi:hypothetical protein
MKQVDKETSRQGASLIKMGRGVQAAVVRYKQPDLVARHAGLNAIA